MKPSDHITTEQASPVIGQGAKESGATFISDFAIIDVKDGREALAARIVRGEKVRVRIEAEIDCAWSDDDGVSQEFGLVVHGVEVLNTAAWVKDIEDAIARASSSSSGD